MNKIELSLGKMFSKTAHKMWQPSKEAQKLTSLQELSPRQPAKLLHIPSVKWRKQNEDLRSNYE